MSKTKKQLMEELDKKGIEYSAKDKREDLELLLTKTVEAEGKKIAESEVKDDSPKILKVTGELVLDSCPEGKITFYKGVYTVYNERGQVLQKGEDSKTINKLYKQYTAKNKSYKTSQFLQGIIK